MNMTQSLCLSVKIVIYCLYLSVSECCFTPNKQLFGYIMTKTGYIQWNDDDARFELEQCDLYSISSLKQKSTDKLVAPLVHIILTSSQPVFACSFSLKYLTEKHQISISIVNSLNRLVLEPTIYRTRGQHANHYTSPRYGSFQWGLQIVCTLRWILQDSVIVSGNYTLHYLSIRITDCPHIPWG